MKSAILPQRETTSVRVGIIDDEHEMIAALRYWLRQHRTLNCVGTWSSIGFAETELGDCRPEVLLLDLHLPGESSLGVIRRIKPMVPGMKVIMITGEGDCNWVRRAMELGADGYLLKADLSGRLEKAVWDALDGGCPLSSMVSRQMVDEEVLPRENPDELRMLTARELMILQYIAEGMLYKEVADLLGISVETVRTHSRRIFRKLEVNTKTEAVLKYLRENHMNGAGSRRGNGAEPLRHQR